MEKTTVYLPKALKTSLQRAARATGTSEAALIRQAIAQMTNQVPAPRPRLPLFTSGQATLAESVDDLLKGGVTTPPFGER